MIYNYPSVMASRSVAGKCPVCGKPVRRTKRFEHTVNPFNLNADGSVKTAREVYLDAKAEASTWVPDFTHKRCGVSR